MKDSDSLPQTKTILIETCLHRRRIRKAKRFSQQNRQHRVLYWRKNENKMEVLQVNKLDEICWYIWRRTYGLQGCCFTQTSSEESHRQLPHVWGEYKTDVNWCLLRALALLLHGSQRLKEETSKLFNSFMNKMDGVVPNHFKRVHMNDIPVVEDLPTLNNLLYDIDIVDGNLIERTCKTNYAKIPEFFQTLEI